MNTNRIGDLGGEFNAQNYNFDSDTTIINNLGLHDLLDIDFDHMIWHPDFNEPFVMGQAWKDGELGHIEFTYEEVKEICRTLRAGESIISQQAEQKFDAALVALMWAALMERENCQTVDIDKSDPDLQEIIDHLIANYIPKGDPRAHGFFEHTKELDKELLIGEDEIPEDEGTNSLNRHIIDYDDGGCDYNEITDEDVEQFRNVTDMTFDFMFWSREDRMPIIRGTCYYEGWENYFEIDEPTLYKILFYNQTNAISETFSKLNFAPQLWEKMQAAYNALQWAARKEYKDKKSLRKPLPDGSLDRQDCTIYQRLVDSYIDSKSSDLDDHLRGDGDNFVFGF